MMLLLKQNLDGGPHLLVYAQVLEGRVWLLDKPQIQEEQCGLHPGCGTVEKLFTLGPLDFDYSQFFFPDSGTWGG